MLSSVLLITDTHNKQDLKMATLSVPTFWPLWSPQVVLGATEELLPHSLCGVHGHGDPPGGLPPGVQEAKHDPVLWGGYACCGQLHARAVVHAEQWPEKETEDFGEPDWN